MTAYTLRVTIICPDAMIEDANSFAACVVGGSAGGAANLSTFSDADWQDDAGNTYAVASAIVRPAFVAGVSRALSRPAWDITPYSVNMTGAERAQAALVIHDPVASVAPDPERLLAYVQPDQRSAINSAGLFRIEASL